jgi:hypothetical protein
MQLWGIVLCGLVGMIKKWDEKYLFINGKMCLNAHSLAFLSFLIVGKN